MNNLPTVSRKDVIAFTASAFQILEVSLEGTLKELFSDHYLWTLVRRITKSECALLGLDGIGIEIRPKGSTETFVVSRPVSGLEAERRAILLMRRRETLSRDLTRSDSRGPIFHDLRRQLLAMARKFEIHFFKGSPLYREIPNWTSMSLLDRYTAIELTPVEAQGFNVTAPAALLLPENEILAPRRFLCARRENSSVHSLKRWSFLIQDIPSDQLL